MVTVSPKNWSRFRHYKNRSNRKWIKLNISLLNDFGFASLCPDLVGAAVILWLTASEIGDPDTGRFEMESDRLADLLKVGGDGMNRVFGGLSGLFDVSFSKTQIRTSKTISG